MVRLSAFVSGVFLSLVLLSSESFGQTPGWPKYHNHDSAVTLHTESFPLYMYGNQVQYVFAPGAFKAGSKGKSAGNGIITTIYVKIHAVLSTSSNYTDFTLKLAQNVDTSTFWPKAEWDTALTTVFYKKNITLTDTAHSWLKVPLQTKFKYDSSKSLVFEFSVSSGTGHTTAMTWPKGKPRIWGKQGSSKPTGHGRGLLVFGFDMAPVPPNDAGILGLTAPKSFCPGKEDIAINLVNNGSKPMDSVRINWSINDTLQPTIYYKKKVDIQGSTSGNTRIVNLGSRWFSENDFRTLKVWTSHPNGQVDTVNIDDTLSVRLRAALNGKYTIGGSGADYQSFSAVSEDLNSFGICGPVYFKIATGTYTEQLKLNNVGGVSSTNTITFDGSGRTSTIIEHDGTGFNDWQTVLIEGTDYVTLKNMRMIGLDSTFGIGVHLVNVSHNLVDSCDIIMPDNPTTGWLYGLAGSGYTTSAIPASIGNGNVISNLYIYGGYSGIQYTGDPTLGFNKDNKFINNQIDSFSRYGIYLSFLRNAVITNNEIVSLRTPDVDGMWFQGLTDFTCSYNYVKATYIGINISFANYYAKSQKLSRVFNNVVVQTGPFNSCFGLSQCRNVDVSHNSFSGNGFFFVSFGDVDSIRFQNNILQLRARYGYLLSFEAAKFSAQYNIDHNVYHIIKSASPSVVVDRVIAYQTLSDWFSTVTSMNQHSLVKDPKFVNNSDLHIKPDGRYSGDSVGVVDDFDRHPRCLNAPTIGAYELPKGSIADTALITKVCSGDTLLFPIKPPSGLVNADYGKTWEVASMTFATSFGYKSSNISISHPTASQAGYIQFIPDSNDVDSSFFMNVYFSDNSGRNCDSIYGAYVEVYDVSMASFSIDTTHFCYGHKTKLKNHSSINAYTQNLWRMGNGYTSNKIEFDYTYPGAGVYNLKLTVSNPACTNEVKTTVYVGSSSGAKIRTSKIFTGTASDGTRAKPDIGCFEDTLVYEVTAPTNLINEQYNEAWRISNIEFRTGGMATAADTFTQRPDSARNFTIAFVPTTQMSRDTIELIVEVNSMIATGCSTTFSRYIVIEKAPSPGFTSTAACLGQDPVQFTDTSTRYGVSYTYLWNFGDSSFSTSQNPSHGYADTGSYLVSLNLNSANGCQYKTSSPLNVTLPPKANYGFIPKCVGQAIPFGDSTVGGNVVSRQWNFGDGALDTISNPTHVFAKIGKFNVKLLVTNANGCMDSTMRSVESHTLPISDFVADSVCLGHSTTFVNKASLDSAAQYKWTFETGDTLYQESPIYTFLSAGSHAVSLFTTNHNGYCTSSKTKEVVVHPIPNLTFIIEDESHNEKRFVPSDSVGLDFTWHFGDGDSSKQISPVHIYNVQKGAFAVELKAVNSYNCAFNKIDTAHVWPSTTSERHEHSLIKIYPNPVQDKLFIDFFVEQNSMVNVQLYDGLGRNVGILVNESEFIGQNKLELNTRTLNLKESFYIVEVQINNVAMKRAILYVH